MTSTEPKFSWQQYRDLASGVAGYWRSYGAWREVICSPFVHIAIFVTVLSSGYWMSSPWHATAVSLLPNLLGFGVTGYAIWIGWGDEKLREALMDIGKGEKGSGYVQISAIFAHFGMVQCIALVLALVASALDYQLSPKSGLACIFHSLSLPTDTMSYLRPFGAAVGYFFFVYAIFTALETTLALFRLAGWVQKMRKMQKTKPTPQNQQ
ncbi:hypothetical protein [Janthinobacterium aquaticum]|uniref:hypothetical protein n=1 Tax=Janthinobacterium sp. FT58W TaxID=2654254 RepID=UPI0012655969|nr:hypothetical protein [Janthinobacterium sp. FT58W]KAB8043146.1 hypothetical protein GCM43_11030 [Janthinobacterium sp. FT58W]